MYRRRAGAQTEKQVRLPIEVKTDFNVPIQEYALASYILKIQSIKAIGILRYEKSLKQSERVSLIPCGHLALATYCI